MKKRYLIFLVLALLITSCEPNIEKDPTPAPTLVDVNNETKTKANDGDVIKIFHLNDTHGAIEHLPNQGEPGMSRIAGYINNKKEEEQTNVVLVSSGDMFQGSLDSNINHGRLMLDIMKEMKFDAMAIGNHEFDWGLETLTNNALYAMDKTIKDWSLPFLAGNILSPNNEFEFGYLSTTFNRGPARVSIIGSIDSSVYNSIDRDIVEGYRFTHATSLVVNEAQKLRNEGSDIIIYTTHTGGKIDSKIINEVDVVFTGHDHVDLVESKENQEGRLVPIIESGHNGQLLGEVSFIYDESKDKFLLDSFQNTTLYEPYIIDEGVENIYNSYLDAPANDGPIEAESLRSLKYESIGEITEDSTFVVNGKINENNVRRMFLEAQLERFKNTDNVIASFYNASRSPWVEGPVTYSDIYKAFPFDNSTVIVSCTGQQLKKWTTAGVFLEGYSLMRLEANETYKVVTSTYITNNYEPYNFESIVREERELYQRHIFYQAFQNTQDVNPWG